MISMPVLMDRKLGYTKSKFSHDTFQMSVHIHGYVCFGTMRNAIKFSVHAESVTSLDMILPIREDVGERSRQCVVILLRSISSLGPVYFHCKCLVLI